MLEINTPFGRSEIYIQKGLFWRAVEILRRDFKGKILVVSDSNVYPLYGERLLWNLKNTGDAEKFVFPAGEGAKSLMSYGRLLGAMAAFEMSRSDMVVALGGGVTGDLAGFAAATFKRGVRFVMIPTSLLSQVDASVGGKTAINLSEGKNLAGAFYAAEKVLIDPDLIETLPEREIASGMAEVIKCAAIRDRALWEFLLKCRPENMEEKRAALIERAVKIKADIVQRDPYDAGERMLLNFGHTFGHAAEKASGTLLHGEAVAIGMMAVTRRSEALGLTKKGTEKTLSSLLEAFQLPAVYKGKASELQKYLLQDKKVLNGKRNIVILKEAGQGEICPAPDNFWEDTVCGQD